MRIALAQVNPTVGDLAGNCRRIIDFISRARSAAADIVVFPELSIIGYPPKDLLLKPQFIEDNLRALRMIAARVSGIEAIVGYAERNPDPVGRPLHNALAVIRGGQIVSRHFKTLLPTYDVFDESRYFEPGPKHERNQVVRIGDTAIGLSICEDLWNDERLIARRLYHQNPIADLHAAGAQVVINASASPFVVNKHAFRLELFAEQARRFGKPLVYVNQVGGNDELIFDGNSAAFDSSGNIIAHGADFEEDLVVVDLPSRGTGLQPLQRHSHAQPTSPIESINKALLLGLRDYVRKCGFQSVVLGLSGGIDSAVTAALAATALGPAQVTGVAMPSRFSSPHSLADAEALANSLGIAFHVIHINDVHETYERTLAPVFKGLSPDVTEENLQARIRGALLMAFSNKFNHLLLTTGNKSEIAVGYCTLYGDMAGGLGVISDVPKTMVYELAEFINRQAGRDLIPRSSITKPPSAELRPDQTDQDSLPPYPILDAILHRYVEEEKGAPQIIAEGFDPQTVLKVVKLIDNSEYKRRQAAPGLKVTSRAFGVGRRMPIAQRYRQVLPRHGEPSPTLEETSTDAWGEGWGYEPARD
jgi:NAD+ synthase (glutamine-hydrolysing)